MTNQRNSTPYAICSADDEALVRRVVVDNQIGGFLQVQSGAGVVAVQKQDFNLAISKVF